MSVLGALFGPFLGLASVAAEPSTRMAASDVGLEERFAVLFLRSPGAKMVRIAASTFRMGSTPEEVVEAFVDCQREQRGPECDPARFANEGPVRKIALSGYFIDRTEVTVAAYDRCVELGRCSAIPFPEGARRFDSPELPATFVGYEDAAAYCAFRGARLPTEAEWERAARGPGSRRYPWGNLWNGGAANHGRFAWNPTDAADGFAELAPVGSYPAGRTREGIDDLAGNVAEWVSDRYAAEYSATDLVNPLGPGPTQGTPERIVRGGSWESAPPFLRSATRTAVSSSTRAPTIGFRCAVSDRTGG
ncbi:MAG TPA: formylglycine-generating enzyme family protein [Polyangiaceae bacterium]|nr:formylglycine-generating enzyme family protein [Polyangiaceae bacterium]